MSASSKFLIVAACLIFGLPLLACGGCFVISMETIGDISSARREAHEKRMSTTEGRESYRLEQLYTPTRRIARDAVESVLKAPSTAEFGQPAVWIDPSGQVIVEGKVTASNSFGVPLVQSYRVLMIDSGSGNPSPVALYLDGKVVLSDPDRLQEFHELQPAL